jgi:glucose/mannose-6-phosphate isomerase
MIDDLKYIHDRDAQDALGIAEKQWQQLHEDFEVNWQPKVEIKNIIVGGMGGSALAASFIPTWPKTSVPYEIVRDYDLPPYAGSQTLFIASSYSGNTEETLSALRQAEERGCQIGVITSGGALAEQASQKGYPMCLLPAGVQPRMAALANLAALIALLEPTGLVGEGRVAELREAGKWLKNEFSSWLPTAPSSRNQAKQLALEVIGKSPVVYAGPKLFPAAYKWKISFNENAKNVAWCSQIPEFNHNEFLGWTSHPTEKPYAVIDLTSDFEHDQVKKRFEISDRLLSGKRPAAITVEAKGDTVLKQLLWTVALGDFVSLYTALLNGLNPTPVELIEKLKKALVE